MAGKENYRAFGGNDRSVVWIFSNQRFWPPLLRPQKVCVSIL